MVNRPHLHLTQVQVLSVVNGSLQSISAKTRKSLLRRDLSPYPKGEKP